MIFSWENVLEKPLKCIEAKTFEEDGIIFLRYKAVAFIDKDSAIVLEVPRVSLDSVKGINTFDTTTVYSYGRIDNPYEYKKESETCGDIVFPISKDRGILFQAKIVTDPEELNEIKRRVIPF